TLPISNVTKMPASRCRQMEDVVVRGKNHQHQYKSEPDSEPHSLRALRQWPSPHRLHGVEQKVATIQKRHRKQVEKPDRNRKHGGKMHQGGKADGGDLP